MATVPTNDIGIQGSFITANRCYQQAVARTKTKLMLHSTATPGAPAQNFVTAWNKSSAQAAVEFCVDNEKILQLLPIGAKGKGCIKSWHAGAEANNTHVATELCEPLEAQLIPINYQPQSKNATYKRSYSIKRIQMELTERGYYNGEVNGVFGDLTDAAVRAFQKDQGITVDGSVGKTTLAKLANREGSYCAYDVEGATAFFNATYNNAVALFGWLCGYLGGKASEIICHSEGYKQGIASNHADVMHWFPYHGKSMDDFRKDVQSYIDGTWVPLGSTVSNPTPDDEEYLRCVENLVDAAIIDGDVAYWEDLVTADKADTSKMIQIIINTAQYFINKSHVYAVDALVHACGINSPAYWQGTEYSFTNVGFLIKAIAKALDKTDADYELDEAVDVCAEYGILGSKDYWKTLSKATINMGNVQILMKNAARYFADGNMTTALYAIQNAIGMNSIDWWVNASEYPMNNVRFLFRAIANNL